MGEAGLLLQAHKERLCVLALPQFGRLAAAAALGKLAGTLCLLLLDALGVKLAVSSSFGLSLFLCNLLHGSSVGEE